MSEPIKLCKDCRHLLSGAGYPRSLCARPTDFDDPVLGGKRPLLVDAHDERMAGRVGACGCGAAYFTPRPTEPSSLWGRFIARLNRPTNSTGPGCPVRARTREGVPPL